jgi:hypothetical protein
MFILYTYQFTFLQTHYQLSLYYKLIIILIFSIILVQKIYELIFFFLRLCNFIHLKYYTFKQNRAAGAT